VRHERTLLEARRAGVVRVRRMRVRREAVDRARVRQRANVAEEAADAEEELGERADEVVRGRRGQARMPRADAVGRPGRFDVREVGQELVGQEVREGVGRARATVQRRTTRASARDTTGFPVP
jgi:hypothetical protein